MQDSPQGGNTFFEKEESNECVFYSFKVAAVTVAEWKPDYTTIFKNVSNNIVENC